MKYLSPHDITEFIEWVCPYKNCEFLNTEFNEFGIKKEYKCVKCKRSCGVKEG